MRDCLLNQLALNGRSQSLAARILRDQFKLLVRRRIPDLSRKTGATKEDIEDAIAEIGRLDPAPGKQFSADSNTVIEPDVTVYKDEYGEWQILLNNDYIPRLRINGVYKDRWPRTVWPKEKDFLWRECVQEILINSIEQRQQTRVNHPRNPELPEQLAEGAASCASQQRDCPNRRCPRNDR